MSPRVKSEPHRRRPSPPVEVVVLAVLLVLSLLAFLLPWWLTHDPRQRLEFWLFAGVALGPLVGAALVVCLYARSLKAARGLDPEGYYALLDLDPKQLRGLPEADAQALITRQYRSLAHRHHPDLGSLTDRMPHLNRAYSVLKDPEQRRAYDGRQ